MYQDELDREAKMIVQGWQYIVEDVANFFNRVAAALGLRGRR